MEGPVGVRWGVGEVVAGHCQWRDEPGTYPPPLTTLTRPKSTKTNSSFGKRLDLDPVSVFLLQLPSLFVYLVPLGRSPPPPAASALAPLLRSTDAMGRNIMLSGCVVTVVVGRWGGWRMAGGEWRVADE